MPPVRRAPGPFRPTSTAIRAVRPSLQLFEGKTSLLRALSRQLGGDEIAADFLSNTLEDSGLAFVPEGREPFVAFVREEILPRLMPIVRLEQLHDVVRRTIGEEGSLHPPPLKKHGSTPSEERRGRPRVIVVEPDAFRRVAIARSLVRAGFDVEVVAHADEALSVDAFHAIVLAMDADGERVVGELSKRRTRAGLVTYDDPAARDALRRAIDLWPSDRVAILARDAQPATLCARVRIVIA